ncbi:MAG TPA: DivIVA domain-containing protein [Solirubrobacter sp.]|nr:DivIVA domain-containing protein [Solirubrobacter sp.]
MDREEIQRRDFPTGRRGYEPSAVDEHLRRVADAFETRAELTPPTLSGATADQVRAILEAAERSVSELHTRANEEASDHVVRVQSAADGMLAKLDALESELGNLLSALRASGERLTRGLADLQAEVARGGASDIPVEEDFAAAAPPTVDDAAPGSERLSGSDDAAATRAAAAADSAAADRAPGSGADEAGARLIALNMALGGASREETARYLTEHFSLAEPDALLDDVYARAGR